MRRGSFVNGVLHGDGEETDGAGRDSYVGQFERGVRHGRGRVRRSDGSSWDGEWEAGEARGERRVRAGRTSRPGLGPGLSRRGCEEPRATVSVSNVFGAFLALF